tara:strand:- start:3533 stop:3724 length:192 start_codon:yes stop_codon:yes gene_type:complete
MFLDIDIWRFIITIGFAKSLSWKKGGDAYLVHIGTLRSEDGDEVAVKIIFLPFLILLGFRKFK